MYDSARDGSEPSPTLYSLPLPAFQLAGRSLVQWAMCACSLCEKRMRMRRLKLRWESCSYELLCYLQSASTEQNEDGCQVTSGPELVPNIYIFCPFLAGFQLIRRQFFKWEWPCKWMWDRKIFLKYFWKSKLMTHNTSKNRQLMKDGITEDQCEVFNKSLKAWGHI